MQEEAAGLQHIADVPSMDAYAPTSENAHHLSAADWVPETYDHITV